MQPKEANLTDRPSTMYEVVQRWAERTPDAPALVAKDRLPLTYGALAKLGDRFQRSLNYHGLGRNDRIAVVHSGGAEMAATIVGIWSCAAAAPMNPAYTIGEFAINFRDLGISAVLVDATMDTPARPAARQLGLPILEIELEDERVAGMVRLRHGAERSVRDAGRARLDDLATVLATSGTTSHRKIVPLHHRELWWKYANAVRCQELTPEDRCLSLMPLFHGHGINTGLGINLWSGGSTINLQEFDIETFADYIQTLEPTWYTGAFTFHHQILAHAERLKSVIATSSIRFARSGSGPLDARVGKEIEEALAIPVIQTYSTTETGIISGNPRPPRKRKHGSVGFPASDGVAIMDPNGKVLLAGNRGEVVVSGEHVFKGYENDLVANAAAFNGDWFRTGDEGMFDDDGFLFLTGRIKELINRGGQKISPYEIDEALLAHPQVAAASAFPVPHPTLGEEVAAAVVLDDRASVDEASLLGFLRESLAEYKVPRHLALVEDIPKGPTGKIQRHELASALGMIREPGAATISDEDRPATALEAKLQALWASALGVEHVGLHDDFFLLGGDSLQAVELFLRIEKTLGRSLPRSVLFEAGTVAEMAQCVELSSPTRCLVPIRATGGRPIFFCVHGISGQVLNFRALAQHLGEDQPFYGIQSVGLDGAETPLARIEKMAARYIAEIRRLQPMGPYYFGGYSMGGRVACEMARQLRATGQAVGMLALLDTNSRQGRQRVTLSQWFGRHWRQITQLRGTAMAEYLVLRIRNLGEMIWTGVRRRLFAVAWRLGEKYCTEMPRFLRRPMDANRLASRMYEARPYDGDAVLVRALPFAWTHADARDSWRDLIRGDLEVRPISCLHFEILEEPYVRDLARDLADCLNERQACPTREMEDLVTPA